MIEIVSPESAARDRGDKFYEYEQGGVPEYWPIDPAPVIGLREVRHPKKTTKFIHFYAFPLATGRGVGVYFF